MFLDAPWGRVAKPLVSPVCLGLNLDVAVVNLINLDLDTFVLAITARL